MFVKCKTCGASVDVLAIEEIVKFAKDSGSGRVSINVDGLVGIHVILEKELIQRVQAVIDEYDVESERIEMQIPRD